MEPRKKLQDLTFKDNFLFGAVMTDERHCRDFLELALGFPIERVTVDKEKSIVYHPEYKGVRLDVYAKDAQNTHYNVEMQVAPKPALAKRVRYYHSQMDMELLLRGSSYEELPDAYVIFICDFDPFGGGRYQYTFENVCKETGKLLGDGSRSIFLSTCGENASEVSKELVSFLNFVKASLPESTGNFGNTFVQRLQETIRQIKQNREMGERYMLFEELLQDERLAGKALGKAEAVLELLEDLGDVPAELREKILGTTDLETLRSWHKLAARAESVDNFLKKIQ